MKNISLVMKAFFLLAFFSLGAGQAFATGNHSHNDGSITVCKMIVDNEGDIATSSQGLPSGSFSITISKGNVATSSIPLQTVTFDALTFSPNKKIISDEETAQCVKIDGLDENASYFYSEETVTGSDWISKKYNDQNNVTIDSISDFFAYSPELWNADPSDDGSRNTNSDGHIVLTESRSHRTVVILNTYRKQPEPEPGNVVTIVSSKIVCDAESDLPNWSSANTTITVGTASDFVASYPNCHLESGWKFQWGYADKQGQDGVDGLSGAFIGEADGSEGTNTDTGSAFNEWKTFGPTDQNGTTFVEIGDLLGSSRIWVREVLKDGYVPFTYSYGNDAPGSDESAEMWCHNDVLNYDNFDFVINPQLGQTYYCIAFNALKTSAQNPVCSDGLDNDTDTKTDGEDPACHTDGNPDNQNTYDPNGNTENSKPVITVVGNNPFEMVLNDTFTDPKATAFDEEDGDVTANIVTGGTVTTSIVGSYLVTYDVTDSGGLVADQKTRTVNVNLPANPGVINVCKVIVDQINTVITASSSLPAGSFSIKLASTTDFATGTFQTISWNASTFSPNRNIILNDDDAQCVTVSNLSLGNYYYSEELISGVGAWATTTKYNDQDISSVNNVFDFFVYDNALFTATTTDDAGRNINADGQIILTAGNYNRTLVVLNKYDSTIFPQCSDNADNDGDQKIDSQDPTCHTDGDPNNPSTYDPNKDSENSKPVITLLGDNPVSIIAGSGYLDAGATALDEEDGDITTQIILGGSVNTGNVGSYTITYNVSDSDGLAADQVARTINVNSGGVGGGGGGCEPNCGGGGGGGGGGGANGPIISFSTTNTPTVGGSCYYLFDFLKQGENNNPVEVQKLQVFLNGFEGENLSVNGVFDDATFEAVSRFQNKYQGDILTPWGHTVPTGYVYILSKKKVNEIYCQTAFPVTSPEQAEIDSFRAFLASLSGAGVISESEAQGIVPPFGNINSSEVEGGVVVPGEVGLGGPSTGLIAGIAALRKGATTTNNQGGGFRLQTPGFLSNLAAAAFTLPENIPDAFVCLFTLLLTLAVIYVVSTLIVNGATRGLTRQQMRIRKIIYFIVGTVIAFAGGVVFKIYCLIVPLLGILLVLAALLLWHNNKSDKSISITTTNVGGMKKYDALKTEVKKEENKQVPIILPPKMEEKKTETPASQTPNKELPAAFKPGEDKK